MDGLDSVRICVTSHGHTLQGCRLPWDDIESGIQDGFFPSCSVLVHMALPTTRSFFRRRSKNSDEYGMERKSPALSRPPDSQDAVGKLDRAEQKAVRLMGGLVVQIESEGKLLIVFCRPNPESILENRTMSDVYAHRQVETGIGGCVILHEFFLLSYIA